MQTVLANVVSQTTIAGQPQAVFKYLADLHYHRLWLPQLRIDPPLRKLKAGMHYSSNCTFIGLITVHGDNEVLKLTPGARLLLQNKLGPVRYRVNYRLRARDITTLLICTANVVADSELFGFVAPEFRRLVRHELRTEMRNLRNLVEHDNLKTSRQQKAAV